MLFCILNCRIYFLFPFFSPPVPSFPSSLFLSFLISVLSPLPSPLPSPHHSPPPLPSPPLPSPPLPSPPFLQTHTHSTSGTITTDFNTELRCCDCFSPGAVKSGKELRIYYGARSNAELFLHQGFVYPPNTGDSLRIKMGEAL